MKIGRFGIVLIIALATIVVILALFGPSLVEKRPTKQEVDCMQRPRIGITAKGVVESSEEIVLGSQVKGQIRRMLVSAGTSVSKGQLLLEFEDEKAVAQLQQARAALEVAESRLRELSSGYRSEDVTMAQTGQQRAEAVYREARDEFERQQRLFNKDAAAKIEVTRAEEKLKVALSHLRENEANVQKYQTGVRKEEVKQARATRDRAVADLRYAEGVMKDYRVLAPISGLVAERMRDTGESTEIGAPLLKLINPNLARIRAELEETEVGKVTVGQQAEVSVDAYPGKVFEGSVTKVLPIVQKKTQKSFDPVASFDINTQEIHIGLKDFSALKNGMTVTVRFK
ncbi:MAG: efflux RND transporter periplasmic adaptor subunit [Pedobacter sp.]